MAPGTNQLAQAGPVTISLALPKDGDVATLVVTMDGVDVTAQLPAPIAGIPLVGQVAVPTAGAHVATASIQLSGGGSQNASVSFETTALDNPNECEILNQAECLLPYPSSRFEVPDPTTPSGRRLRIPAYGLPTLVGPALSPAPYNELDGWSLTPQITMHFPGGVDLVQSNAARLVPNGPPQPDALRRHPHVEPPLARLRQPDAPVRRRHRRADLPLDRARRARERKPGAPGAAHARGQGAQARRPLHRRDPRAAPSPTARSIQAEPAFAALRDNRLTDIPAILDRRIALRAAGARPPADSSA